MQFRNSERGIQAYLLHYRLVAGRMIPEKMVDSARITLERMESKRLVSRWIHPSGIGYWTRRAKRPLSNGSLAAAYGRWLFCEETSARSLLRRRQMVRYFPSLARSGMPTGYYVERRKSRVSFGLIKVDRLSRINRLVSTTLKVIDQHRTDSEFRQLVATGQFELTWIVPTAEKARRLTDSLAITEPSGVPVRVVHLPDLLNLLTPLIATN